MSVLNKPYELSIWEDVLVNGVLTEKRICVLGSNTMTSQSRALNPKLVTNVNGTNTFTFSIYYQYKDNITGERVDNPFAQYLTNERKLKLHYNNKWYDLLIKNVKVNSDKWSYDITATDQYINELSKNGFNLTFDAEMNNNVGSIEYLAGKALEDTNWDVKDIQHGSEFIPDLSKEDLVVMVTNTAITAQCLDDTTTGVEPDPEPTNINSGATLYGFYSCCQDQTKRFQFYYFGSTPIQKDNERIIKNKGCQYYIDGTNYNINTTYNIGVPDFANNNSISISAEYRGARYVFAPDVKYNSVLQQYASSYFKNNHEYLGFVKTTYEAPNLIQNWVTNSSEFKSTSGWKASRSVNNEDTPILVTTDALRLEQDAQQIVHEVSLMDDLRNGGHSGMEGHTYTSVLKYTHTTAGLLVNSGFYDNRTAIGNLENGTEYIVRLKLFNRLWPETGAIMLGSYPYDALNNVYTLSGEDAVTYFYVEIPNLQIDADGWYWAKVTINNANFTPREYKSQDTNKVTLVLQDLVGIRETLEIEACEVFEYLPGNGKPYVAPTDQPTQAQIINTYYLYNKTDCDSPNTIEDINPVYVNTADPITQGYTQPLSCEKRRSITIKESNYFNIIQTLCENFECWARFDIGHNEAGAITSKVITFHNYMGEDNYAGFRYGVNLKSITRTDDSKQIVTKLIVKQNSNEFGEDGFCTIARAPSNLTGENYIYNMDYYINQGLLSASDWLTATNTYYLQLRAINAQLRDLSKAIASQSIVLSKAMADLKMYQNAKTAAEDAFDEANANLIRLLGHGFNALTAADFDYNEKVKYITICAENYQALQKYTPLASSQAAYVETLKTDYTNKATQQQSLIESKEALNKEFYSKYYRFIQEGTWISEEYYDDEKYYLDSVSTLYNSSVPQVSYTISVLELSQLEGYQGFTFALGDRTFMEDPDFFGYDSNGNPIREEVLLTEITYNLDSPEKNTIKIQNYKTSFQDLFKKITATVQSVQYSTGAYDQAAQLAAANDQEKSKYLQGALADAGTILENMSEQAVRIDAEGLTISDRMEPNKALRAMSGGILLTEDGGNTWNLGITPNGISAKILTTGTLNTGVVNIMYGNEPTFRWDAYGITAYDFTDPLVPNVYKGVRFDRMGLYGFSLPQGGQNDSADWHPNHISGWTYNASTHTLVPTSDSEFDKYVRNHSIFELTEEGVYLDLGKGNKYYNYYYDSNSVIQKFNSAVSHEGTVQLGKIDEILYNTWSATGHPYYDTSSGSAVKFAKVASIETANLGETFALYDDGAMRVRQLYISDGISFDDGTGLVKYAYITSATRPNVPAGTWSGLPDSDAGWHKNQSTTDNWKVETNNNGGHWDSLAELEGAPGTPGTSTLVQNIYYYTANTSVNAPQSQVTSTATTTNTWTLTYAPNVLSAQQRYGFKAVQTIITYPDTTTTFACTNPELYIAFDDSSINEQYAQYLKLTNFGNLQGLYYDEGDLFINASYIHTGTLDATNVDVINLNANNITSGRIDASVIQVINLNASNITSGSINAQDVQITNLNASNITGGSILIGTQSGNHLFIDFGTGANFDIQAPGIKISSGEGTITANVVRTGTLESIDYEADPTSEYAAAGAIFDLTNEAIRTPFFYTTNNGAGFKGNLTADNTQFKALSLVNEGVTYATIGYGTNGQSQGFKISMNDKYLFFTGTPNNSRFTVNTGEVVIDAINDQIMINEVLLQNPKHVVDTLPTYSEMTSNSIYWLKEADATHPGWTKLTPYIWLEH